MRAPAMLDQIDRLPCPQREFAVDSAVRNSELGEVVLSLEVISLKLPSACATSIGQAMSAQILPAISFCIRFAISTSRRQACSRNDIARSISRSLGRGISILRS